MADQTILQKIFNDMGFSDFRWVDSSEIIVAQWVRMKTMFGSSEYGRNASCPPNTPSVEECRQFFNEYRLAAVFRIPMRLDDPEQRYLWSRDTNRTLLEMERQVSDAGYRKAFLLFVDTCTLCRECTKTRAACRNKQLARPTPEGMAVDVCGTVAKFGYQVEAHQDEQRKDCYAFLMIE